MKYKKRINNNVVVVIDDNHEQILTGRGIGFQIPYGEKVDESIVEKVIKLVDNTTYQPLQELLQTIPVENATLAEEIMMYARKHITNEMNGNVIVSLCDHSYIAVERKNKILK